MAELAEVSSLYIEIPDACREVKAIFPEPPGEDIVQEIKDFIAETGEPWMWRGHTHTKPPQGALIQYCGRFDIPKQNRDKKLWVPCPCCWPNHRKFGEGLIAWFPEEQVVRMVGPRCFRSINEQGHDAAYADLTRRENERKELDHVVRSMTLMPNWLRAAEELAPVAAQADQFFGVLENRIRVSLDFPIWREIRTGTLYITERIVTQRVGRDGKSYDHTERHRTPLVQVDGFRALSDKRKLIGPTVTSAYGDLLKFRDLTEEDVRAMTPENRARVSQEIRRLLRLLREKRDELDDQLRLLDDLNMARLRQWTRNSLSGANFTVERRDGIIYLSGRKDYPLPIPELIRSRNLPDFDEL